MDSFEAGGLWNIWEVRAMSINQSQPQMRLHPILLHSRFHRKPAASLVFGLFGARVLAARLACYKRSALYPCTPHFRREFSKRRGSFPFFPLTKTTTCPPPRTFRETFVETDIRTTIPTPPWPASSSGPQLFFHFNDLNPNYTQQPASDLW